jgi:putative transposase
MPWKDTCPMEQKLQFIIESRSGTLTMTALCALFGISRQTGYKWRSRFSLRRGEASLEEHSRRPHRTPLETPKKLVDRILRCRHHHPTWGPRKLLAYLRHHGLPSIRWPAASTIGDILKRHGLVRPRRRRLRAPPRTQPFSRCTSPNDVWCVDFKGQFRTGDGALCYPLTVMDAASRFLLACVALRAPEGPPVRAAFEQLFARYGLPKAIRSDNGLPFASSQSPGTLTTLSAWWVRLGIRLERIDPGKPQQNGRHERMHLTLKHETALPPRKSFAAQARAFDAFRQLYNHVRPHEALGQRPPAQLYSPSRVALPSRLPEFQYPFSDPHLVDHSGAIVWGQRRFFVSTALAGQTLGAYCLDDRYVEIRFGPILLGIIDCTAFWRGLIRPWRRAKR